MMHRIRNQDKWLGQRARPIMRRGIKRRRVHRRGSPRVPFTVDESQPGVGDAESAVLVNRRHIRRSGDVEGEFADQALVGEIVGP